MAGDDHGDDRMPGAPDEAGEVGAGTPLTQQVGRVVIAATAVLFVAFTLFNRHPVEVSWVFTSTETPLILLLLAGFVVGVAAGAVLSWRRRRDRARRDADPG